MNKVILMGRLTKDPEIRYTSGTNATAVCRYSLAVNRQFKREGEPETDFFNCVTFGNRAEFSAKYLHKGTMIAVVGELRNSNYTDKSGNKRYTTDIVVSETHFAGSSGQLQTGASEQNVADSAPAGNGYTLSSKRQSSRKQDHTASSQPDDFMPIDADIDGEDLPF